MSTRFHEFTGLPATEDQWKATTASWRAFKVFTDQLEANRDKKARRFWIAVAVFVVGLLILGAL